MTIRKKDRGLKDYLKRNNGLQITLLFIRMFHMKHSDFCLSMFHVKQYERAKNVMMTLVRIPGCFT